MSLVPASAVAMMTGNSETDRVRRMRLQGLDAVHVGHHHVEQHEIERLLLDHRQRGSAAVGFGDVVPGARQLSREQLAVRGLVVDEKEASRSRPGSGAIVGSRDLPAGRRRGGLLLGAKDAVDKAQKGRWPRCARAPRPEGAR